MLRLLGLRQVAPVLVCGTLAGHVVSKPDQRGDLYPAKPRPEQKIDAAVALMMAVGRAMAEEPTKAT
jgi:phage terminase large subunit-like protein